MATNKPQKSSVDFDKFCQTVCAKYGVEIVDQQAFDARVLATLVEVVGIRLYVDDMIGKGIVRKPEPEEGKK